MNLVIVESPAKAKTINKYLGDNYKVLASYGHIRDLPSKNGSVNPDQDFKMEWEVDSFSKKYLKEITDAAKDSSKIILATDPDREGEAIAWHVKEYLNEKTQLKNDYFFKIWPSNHYLDIETNKNKSARLEFDKINFKSNKTNFLVDFLKLDKGEYLENCFRLENFLT